MKRKRIAPIPEGLKTLIKRYDDSENERVKEHIREWLDESPLFESEEDEREWRREVDAWTQPADLTNITFSVIKPERKYRTLDDYDRMIDSELEEEGCRCHSASYR